MRKVVVRSFMDQIHIQMGIFFQYSLIFLEINFANIIMAVDNKMAIIAALVIIIIIIIIIIITYLVFHKFLD